MLFGVPQRSTQDPCFLIFFCDLFFSMNETDFTSCAENNIPYVAGMKMLLIHLKMIHYNYFNGLQTTK